MVYGKARRFGSERDFQLSALGFQFSLTHSVRHSFRHSFAHSCWTGEVSPSRSLVIVLPGQSPLRGCAGCECSIVGAGCGLRDAGSKGAPADADW